MKKRNTVEQPDDLERVYGMTPTLAELELIDVRRDYECLRKIYFKDRPLPPVACVAINFVPVDVIGAVEGIADGDFFACVPYARPEALKKFATILIAAGIGRNQTRLSLLHEMAHISVGLRYAHGPTWQREMHRIAGLGCYERWW